MTTVRSHHCIFLFFTYHLIAFLFRSILVADAVYADYQEQLFVALIQEILAYIWVNRVENRFTNLLKHIEVLTSIYNKTISI